jgi:hypothetical protein
MVAGSPITPRSEGLFDRCRRDLNQMRKLVGPRQNRLVNTTRDAAVAARLRFPRQRWRGSGTFRRTQPWGNTIDAHEA